MRALFLLALNGFRAAVMGVVALSCCSTAYAQTPRLELVVMPGSAPAGEVAKVQIQFKSSVGVGAVQFEIVYDTAVLKFKRVENGPQLPGGLLEANEVQPGRVRVALISNEEVKGSGVLLLSEFESTLGAAGTTSVNLESVRAWDLANNLPLLVAAQAGDWTRTVAAATVGLENLPAAAEQNTPLWVYGVSGLAVLAAVVFVIIATRRR